MNDSDSIDTIYAILEHGFERHIIEDFFEAHNKDMERTLDALMNLSPEEHEGLQQNRIDNENMFGELGNEFGRIDLSPVQTSNDNEDDSVLLPELENHTSILNGLVNMFEGQIPSSKLQKLLLEIIQENGSISNEELSARAADSIMTHIEIANLAQIDESEQNQFEDVADTESFEISPDVNLKRDYNLFVCMFSGVIKDNRMKKLWKQSMESCLGKAGSKPRELSEAEQDDVMDVAVVTAMEFMDTAERKSRDANINADSQLAASLAAEDGYVYNPPPSESDLSGYDIDEEQEYYSGLSTQQAALQFVKMLLGDELTSNGRRITDLQIEQALEACNYDVEECIDQLQAPAAAQSASGKVAPSSSSSKSDKSQPVVPISYKQSVSSKQPSAAPAAGGSLFAPSGKQQSFLPIVGPPQKMVYRSFRERHSYLKMNEDLAVHFLGTLKKKNGHVKASLAEDRRTIVFEGVAGMDKLLTSHPSRGVNNVDKYNASHVAVDLHQLGMDVAVQVVDSALTFFLKYIRDYNQRSNFKGYKLVVKFIVGKGLHSPGGVPKIGPAVLSYLANERAELVSCLVEGMIYVTCI
jgi:hypothetical protein